MQIAMISYWSCPLTALGIGTAGGLNVYVLNLARAMGELGHTVDIYTTTHPDADHADSPLHPNVSIVHFARDADDPYRDIDRFAAEVEATTRRRGAEYDVVHAHYYYSGLVGLRLQERLQLPLLVTFHTLGTMKQQYLGIEDRRRIQAEAAIIEQADGIIASTELEAADVMAWHQVSAAKVHTAYPGVDHHRFRPHDRASARQTLGFPQQSNIVLFVGRIDRIKGIDLLIDALARVVTGSDAGLTSSRLVVVGGEPESQDFWATGEARRLQQQIHDHQLEDHVSFVGSKPHTELALFYSAANLVAMPSAYETFGFVALEAMACGACVLASRVGGLQHLIQDQENGRLFEPGKVDELATIMRELLLDRAQQERLGRNAAASSYRYCWDRQAEQVLSVYRSLICHAA
jgi:D-inositol-3-phosphate glycosyltransferase